MDMNYKGVSVMNQEELHRRVEDQQYKRFIYENIISLTNELQNLNALVAQDIARNKMQQNQ